MAETVVYKVTADAHFNYSLGHLEYRSLQIETEQLKEENHQGVVLMKCTEREVPYTCSIEHKHLEFEKQPMFYVTKEYPADWQPGEEAYNLVILKETKTVRALCRIGKERT